MSFYDGQIILENMILKGKEAYTKTCNKGSQLLRKYKSGQWRNQRPLDSPPKEGKNTIGDGGKKIEKKR